MGEGCGGHKHELSGSQWTLKRVSVWNGTAFAALNSAETWNITDCDATCTPANAGDPYDSDATAGQFKLAGLKWGEYELMETVAPDGYNMDTTAHKFTIGPKDSTVVLEAQLGNIENQPGGGVAGDGRRRKYEDFGYGIACGHGIRCDGRTGPESQERRQ
mgnify:FL=1